MTKKKSYGGLVEVLGEVGTSRELLCCETGLEKAGTMGCSDVVDFVGLKLLLDGVLLCPEACS
jgi:hypothetical protein